MSLTRLFAVAMLVSVIVTTIGLAVAEAESNHLGASTGSVSTDA